MHVIDAKAVIGTEVEPTADGEKLGRHIRDLKLQFHELEIDVTGLAPEDLVSSFVNAILHVLASAHRSIADAERMVWKARFPKEADRLAMIVSLYVEDWKKPSRRASK